MSKCANFLTNFLKFLCICFVAAALAGCGGLGSLSLGDLFSSDDDELEPLDPNPSSIGAIQNSYGPKVAFLIPLGIGGAASEVAQSLKEAGEMALVESGSPGITLLTKDTLGTPEGARIAAETALNEGAELVIGPLFRSSVQTVAPVAQGRGVPVMTFSTSSSVAGNGVYLMSFLPEQDVANIVRYAARAGRTRFAALVPETAYGSITERALSNELLRTGGRLVTIKRYPRNPQGATRAAQQIVASLNNPATRADTLLIAEGGDMLRSLGTALSSAGLNPNMVKIVGTSLWDDPVTSTIDIAVGGWYPGVDPRLTGTFNARFRNAYGREPKRIASLAYDAISLAIAIGRQNEANPPGQRFPMQTLVNMQGFQGINGLFRFTPGGLNERGLAILEVTRTGPRVISPAPGKFAASF